MDNQALDNLDKPNDNLIKLKEINNGKSISDEMTQKMNDFIRKINLKAYGMRKDSLDAVLDIATKQMGQQRGGGMTRSRSLMQQMASR